MTVIGNIAGTGIVMAAGGALGGGIALATRDDHKKREFTSGEVERTILISALGAAIPTAIALFIGGPWGNTPRQTQDVLRGVALLGGLGTMGFQLGYHSLN